MIAWLIENWRIAGAGIALTAFLALGGYIHHEIYQSGVQACEARYTAVRAKNAQTAQITIQKSEENYEKIGASIKKSAFYAKPVSPLVALAISRMPEPHTRAK